MEAEDFGYDDEYGFEPEASSAEECAEKVLKLGHALLLPELWMLRQALQASHPNVEVSGVLARQLPEELDRLGIDGADRVLSTVPWTLLPEHIMERELDGVEAILRPGGRFITLAYIHTHPMKASKRLEDSLRRRFATVTQSGVVWRNVPPGRWLVAESPRRKL